MKFSMMAARRLLSSTALLPAISCVDTRAITRPHTKAPSAIVTEA
jgi:hypothetical protein